MAVGNEESIYEEIVTTNFPKHLNRRKLFTTISRSISMDGHGQGQKVSNMESMEINLKSNGKETSQEEEIYAVILGDELKCRTIDDLLKGDCTIENNNDLDTSRRSDLMDIAQAGYIAKLGRPKLRKQYSCPTMATYVPASFPKVKHERTQYAEIVHTKAAMEVSFNPNRPTRESDNPVLRQEVVPSNTPSPISSAPPSRNNSFRRSRNGNSTHSTSGDSGIQEDLATVLYENSIETRPTNSTQISHHIIRSSSDTEINVLYENTEQSGNIFESHYENTDTDDSKRRHSSPASPNTTCVYENIDDNEKDLMAIPNSRPRTSSKPIDILRPVANTNRTRYSQSPTGELLYSDLSFNDASTESGYPESFSSSPGTSSLSSDISSNVSTITPEYVSPTPPPLPLSMRPSSLYTPRSRTHTPSFTSIYSAYSVLGSNCFKGTYVGMHSVHKTNSESIDRAVKEVALKANMLGLKTFIFEINNGLVNLVTASQRGQLVSSFSLNDIHNVDKYSKDERFLGFVVSKPGKEAVCHVIQSDQSQEILDAVKDAFKMTSMELPYRQSCSLEKSRGFSGIPTYSQPSLFDDVIRIGSLKIKKSYLVMNDSIAALLEKTNPKDYRYVSLQLQSSSIGIINQITGIQEESHSIPWILSLALYTKDSRYFGYIVSDASQGHKTKMRCYVYRCPSVRTAASILESIRAACQCSHSNQMQRYYSYGTSKTACPPKTDYYSYGTPKTACPLKTDFDRKQRSVSSSSSSSSSEDGNDTHKIALYSVTKTIHEVSEILERSAVDETDVKTVSHTPEVKTQETSQKETSPKVKQTRSLPIFPNTQNTIKENKSNTIKENKKSSFKSRIGGSILKRKQRKLSGPSMSVSLPNLTVIDSEVITPVLRKECVFTVSYLCSAVVNPPLKQKHVKDCYKQYMKEMAKTTKSANNSIVGNLLQLRVVTDEGVTMADLRKPDAFCREFPIDSVKMFITHPETEDCFAFSTEVTGNCKHKYHLFVKAKEPICEIKGAFDLLHQTQKSMDI